MIILVTRACSGAENASVAAKSTRYLHFMTASSVVARRSLACNRRFFRALSPERYYDRRGTRKALPDFTLNAGPAAQSRSELHAGNKMLLRRHARDTRHA